MFAELDVLGLQETWLRKGDQDTLSIPRDFECFSTPACSTKKGRRLWGGLATLVRLKLSAKVVKECTTDFVLVIRVANTFVINVYLPPDGSPFWSNDILPNLRSALAYCRAYTTCEMAVLGDFNSRIGETATILGNGFSHSGVYPVPFVHRFQS